VKLRRVATQFPPLAISGSHDRCLQDRVRSNRVPRLSAPDAAQIAEAVDNLPLAVAQAAAYLHETGLAADEYLRLLHTRAAELLADDAPTGYSVSLAAS
jgi:hypothetical protein